MAVSIQAITFANSSAGRVDGNFVRFLCDTEAELPSANVINGDFAIALDTGKPFKRAGGAWVLTNVNYYGLSSPLATLIPANISQPAAPIVTAFGANNLGVNYRYVLVVHGAGTTAGSAAMVNPFTGNSVLDASHYNIIQTVSQPFATSVDIYRTSPASPAVGYIGSVVPGESFHDTGIIGSTTVAPTIDTGSAGTVLASPLVVNNSSNRASTFPALSVGETPGVIEAGDGYPYGAGPLLALTSGHLTNQTGLLLQSAGGANAVQTFRVVNGTLQQPEAAGTSAGFIVFENRIVNPPSFKWSSIVEAGSAVTAPSTLVSDLFGRYQVAVRKGDDARPGYTIKAFSATDWPAPLNRVGFLLTDYVDFRQYRVGYAETHLTDAVDNYERVDGSWTNGGAIYRFGPVAGGTGTLRSMKLSGASVLIEGALTVGGGTSVANIRHGTSGAMVLGSVTVTDTGCTANTRYFFSAHTLGTISIPGGYYASTRTPGTSFVIASSQATETSTIDWFAVEPS